MPSQEKLELPELEVCRTELCYVTSTDRPTATFFAQFCKFSNEELASMNQAINKHCSEIIARRSSAQSGGDDVGGNKPIEEEGRPAKVKVGRIYCAQYEVDKQWYRAKVLTVDKENKTCSLFYVDYGNLETVAFDSLVELKANQVPLAGRAPFGICCFYQESENYSPERNGRLLDTLMANHVMIKVLERQTSVQWKVDLPKHAYNLIFWRSFDPKTIAALTAAAAATTTTTTTTTRDAKIESGQNKIDSGSRSGGGGGGGGVSHEE